MSLPPSAIGLTQSSRFPLLIFLLRLLAVVPATIGALSLMWNAIFPASATLDLVGHSAGDKLMSLPWVSIPSARNEFVSDTSSLLRRH